MVEIWVLYLPYSCWAYSLQNRMNLKLYEKIMEQADPGHSQQPHSAKQLRGEQHVLGMLELEPSSESAACETKG